MWLVAFPTVFVCWVCALEIQRLKGVTRFEAVQSLQDLVKVIGPADRRIDDRVVDRFIHPGAFPLIVRSVTSDEIRKSRTLF